MSAAPDDKKRCPQCKRFKRRGLFYSNRHMSDGCSVYCKSCECKNKREKYDPSSRRRKLLRTYGLTESQFDRMIIAARGRCEICGKVDKRLSIDHDHHTGKVRGLLCNQHNRGIGMIGDTLKDVQKVVKYLENSR